LPVVVILPVPEYQTVRTWKQSRFAQAVRAAAREAEEQGLTEKQVERQVRQVREEVYRNGLDARRIGSSAGTHVE